MNKIKMLSLLAAAAMMTGSVAMAETYSATGNGYHGEMTVDVTIENGTITGGMTSTPGLAAADSMTDSNIPSVAYATVYPIAMVFLILIIQVIASAVY